MLWFMGSQRVGHDWATELNWLNWRGLIKIYIFIQPRLKSTHSDFKNIYLDTGKKSLDISYKHRSWGKRKFYISSFTVLEEKQIWGGEFLGKDETYNFRQKRTGLIFIRCKKSQAMCWLFLSPWIQLMDWIQFEIQKCSAVVIVVFYKIINQ